MGLKETLEKARRSAAGRESNRGAPTPCTSERNPERWSVTDLRAAPEEEIARAEDARAASPEDLQLQVYLSFLYYSSGRYLDAISLFQALLERGYKPSNQHYRLGNCYHRLGWREQAQREWRLCLEASPPRAIAAKVQRRLEEQDEAC